MRRRELRELHYIAAVDNLPSILARGILSYNRIKEAGLNHVSVANKDVQLLRERKVPGTDRTVHDYACLYINGRNSMMFAVKSTEGAARLVVLGVSPEVLDVHDAVIADANAAAGFTRFFPSPDGLERVDGSVVYAEYWTHDDPFEQIRHKQAMCAEVLVPEVVEPEHIERIHVSCDATMKKVRTLTDIPVEVTPYLFFE